MAKVQGLDSSIKVRLIGFRVIGCMLILIETQIGDISNLWGIGVGVCWIVYCMGLVM